MPRSGTRRPLPFGFRLSGPSLIGKTSRGPSPMAQGVGPTRDHDPGTDGAGKRTMAAYIQDSARLDGTFTAVAQELRPDPAGGVLDVLVARLRQRAESGPAPDTTHEEPERRRQHPRPGCHHLRAATATTTSGSSSTLPRLNGLEAGLLRFLDEILRTSTSSPRSHPDSAWCCSQARSGA